MLILFKFLPLLTDFFRLVENQVVTSSSSSPLLLRLLLQVRLQVHLQVLHFHSVVR